MGFTHLTQTCAPPQPNLSAFYPDFLRRWIAPERHEVAAEEMGKELPNDSSMVRMDSDNTNHGPPHRRDFSGDAIFSEA